MIARGQVKIQMSGKSQNYSELDIGGRETCLLNIYLKTKKGNISLDMFPL